jgi:uncharacterized protein YjbJ (UPF0337 family)
MTDPKNLHRENEEVLGAAKEAIGQVSGDDKRAAEGRREQEHAQREDSLKDAVDTAIKDTSGTKTHAR